ncbi:MAG: phosphate acyltransferase PlsX [Kiloniellales bacterium]
MKGGVAIALDAMGGDKAPEMVVKGASLARERFPDLNFLLFGDGRRLGALVQSLPSGAEAYQIHHTDEVVTNDAKPSQALRQGRNSSMRLAIDAVGDGAAAAVVSAGNTGALMAMSKLVLKTAPGIDRPAIASIFPTERGDSVMLDLGANVECDTDNLVQFAVMGHVFARTVLGLDRPTLGLLNVGSEDQKGHEEVKAAAAVLRELKLPIDFRGFVEGNDICAGTVDVIVTDGFTGNVAVKTAEGTARLYTHFLRQAFTASPLSRLGYLLARGALDRLRVRVDPRRYNGAILLGLNGITVKSHGGTDALGFANAIDVAVEMLQHGFFEQTQAELERLSAVHHRSSADKPRVAAS